MKKGFSKVPKQSRRLRKYDQTLYRLTIVESLRSEFRTAWPVIHFSTGHTCMSPVLVLVGDARQKRNAPRLFLVVYEQYLLNTKDKGRGRATSTTNRKKKHFREEWRDKMMGLKCNSQKIVHPRLNPFANRRFDGSSPFSVLRGS